MTRSKKVYMKFNNLKIKLSLSICIATIVSACSLTPQPEVVVEVKNEDICMNKKGDIIDCPPNIGQFEVFDGPSENKVIVAKPIKSQYSPEPKVSTEDNMVYIPQHGLTGNQHSVLLSEYIEQISNKLIANLSNETKHAVVGITSFVDFSNDLGTLTPVGNIVAEHFTTELFQNGFTVSDYKVKSAISVTPQGDFVFSRNADKLGSSESMTHVLTGTIMYQQTGLLINARIVNFDNKWVISTASGFIPYFILDTVIPQNAKQIVL